MYPSSNRWILFFAGTLLLLSISLFVVNQWGNHYTGNNYFPPHSFFMAFNLLLIYLGLILQCGLQHRLTICVKEIGCLFLITALLALATNAIQYTPFPTIDASIVAFENRLHIDLNAVLTWTHHKPIFKTILWILYDTLPYQMLCFPLLLIATNRIDTLREYYFLLLCSAMIGFSFYYLFPTTAPASLLSSDYFSAEQYATGLKFKEIHEHTQPSTQAGGLIAMPSFHVIWAWFCLYLLRSWPLAFKIMLPLNLLLMSACVLLGWHYVMDLIGGIMVICISHGLYYSIQPKRSLQPGVCLESLTILRFKSHK